VGGSYPPTSFETPLVKEACIPTTGCFVMTYIDNGCVSYNVSKNGEQLFATETSCYQEEVGAIVFAPLGGCLCDNWFSPDFVLETIKPTLFETAPPSDVFTIIPGAIENGTQIPTEGFEVPDAISVTEVSTTAPIVITPSTESPTPDSGQSNSTEPSP
jgi:hypothetical protein